MIGIHNLVQSNKIKRQLVFIGDAGDPGFKFDKGSSSHFVIACIDSLKNNSESFYNHVILKTLDQIPGLFEANIRLDGKPGKNYKQRSINYFRKNLNTSEHKLERFRFADSKGNLLIQLADVVVGSILHTKQDDNDAQRYFELIKPRVHNLWDFK